MSTWGVPAPPVTRIPILDDRLEEILGTLQRQAQKAAIVAEIQAERDAESLHILKGHIEHADQLAVQRTAATNAFVQELESRLVAEMVAMRAEFYEAIHRTEASATRENERLRADAWQIFWASGWEWLKDVSRRAWRRIKWQ